MVVPSRRAARLRVQLRAAAALPFIALLYAPPSVHSQQAAPPTPAARAQRFLSQRVLNPAGTTTQPTTPALAMQRARAQHLTLAQLRNLSKLHPESTANLSAAWQPLGPTSVLSASYSNVTGRVSSIATDPNDPTGNTVYLGTTGGGVWKSTNAAGPLDSATFTPLTDTLPVFSDNAGSTIIPSLSIGAIAVQPTINPVLLAGTGDPNDATDSLYGEGLLRSPDGGLTWTLIQISEDGTNGDHQFTGLATAGIAFSTATPSLVVAAFSVSPQSAVVNAAAAYSIPGLYYSTDAGQTWHMSTLMDGTAIVQQPLSLGNAESGNAATSVVWDAQRAQFFAAIRSHGYYASPDGITWTRLTKQPGVNLTTTNCPVGAGGDGSPNCPIFRGSLAVQPTTGDLYALTVDVNDLDQGLWQDLCNATGTSCAAPAPTFPNRIDNGALETGGGNTAIPQGGYNLVLNASPAGSNSTLLYAGTVDLYRCPIAANSTSCILRNTTNTLDGCNAPAQVAPSQHAIATVAQPSGAPLLFLGNDSGLWRSLDGVAETGSVCSSTDNTHFDNLNGDFTGSLAEVVNFAQDPGNGNILLAGLGANGSAATGDAAALAPWPQLSPGEGGFPLIDPNIPANWYVTIGAGVNLVDCPLGADCTAADFIPPATISAPQVDNDASLLDAPSLLDPNLTTSILTGTCRVWRGPAANGSAWSNANVLSPPFGGSTTPCSPYSPLIRSLAAGGPEASGPALANSGSTVLYAGLSGEFDGGNSLPGHLFVTTTANLANSTTPWTDVSLSSVTNDVGDAHVFNPGQFDVSAIAADPHDASGATVYATVMGFGVPHIYRSTNFGGTWLNLSANLPDAPANAVAIDPNDANTVYIALDTGVYVTQSITTCTTTNCWSVLGTALPNSPVVALAAAAYLDTGDGRIGMLRAATYGRGIWQTPLLTAATPIAPDITLSPSSLTFDAQQVATLSAPQTITVTSSGVFPVTFGTPVITGDFTETDNCAGQTLAVGAACTVQVVFAPSATGPRSGQLTLYANIPGGQAVVALKGTGTTPASVTLTPLALAFPATIVNQTAAAQIITVANTGGTTATLQAPILTGNASDFAISANTCGATLTASTACSLSVTFTPTASGNRLATLSITDTAGTQSAQLTGTGLAPATDTLAPLALSFPQQQIGSSSAKQQVTLTNNGGVALTLITASVTPGDFSVGNACGNSLAAHASCVFNVTFTPTVVGNRTATLSVTDQFRTQTIALTGIGIAGPGVSLSPVALNFAPIGVGLIAGAQTLTLTNNGGTSLSITSVVVSPGFTVAANSCTAAVAVRSACTLTVVFAPTTAGVFTGTLTLTDNAPSGSQTTSLYGTGIDFTLTPSGPTSVTTSGTSTTPATYTLLLSSLPSLSGNVALTCIGAPANATCLVTPSVSQLGGAESISVAVQTGVAVAAARNLPARHFSHRSLIVLALLLPLSLLPRRKRLGRLALLLTFTCALTLMTGCGTSRVIPIGTGTTGSVTTPTPPGTYTLTVGASTAGLTHTVNLTLIVQ